MGSPGYFFQPFEICHRSGSRGKSYHYTKIKKHGNSQGHAKFPISLSIDEQYLTFSITSWISDSGKKDQIATNFRSGTLFSIPLLGKGEVKDLVELFHLSEENGVFEVLDGIAAQNFIRKESDYVSYSSVLDNPANHAKAPGSGSKKQIYIREILLDFLFDFKHSDLFIDLSNYHSLVHFFQEHQFLACLLAKYEFYYYRELRIGALPTFNRALIEKDYPNLTNQIKSRYRDAAKLWLSWIRKEKSEQIISPDNKWYIDIEGEHHMVYFDNNNKRWPKNKEAPDFLKKEAEDSIEWLLKRYHLLGAFRLQFFLIFSKTSRLVILGVMGILALLCWNLSAYTLSLIHI